MNGETSIEKSDFFLREIPEVKMKTPAVIQRKIVKEQLQTLTLSEALQENLMDTFRYIYGPDFKLTDVSIYEESKSNLLKKYWVGQGSLVVKGGVDFSQSKDEPAEEAERLRQFGIMRLESYGFHKNHCLEAFNYCKGDIEDSIYLLYHKYFNWNKSQKEIEHNLTEKELLEQRMDEKSSLESIYENTFNSKTDKEIVQKKVIKKDKQEKCRNLLRGHCKFGNKCRFSHEVEKEEPKINSHLDNFLFELEFRFPPNTQYPYEPPLIFLKTNAVLPPLVNLHICKRLYNEAKILAEDGVPCVYTITELLQNEQEITQHLKEETNFINPHQKLFDEQKYIEKQIKRPSHFIKGNIGRQNKKLLDIKQLKRDDKNIVDIFLSKTKEDGYKKMLNIRKELPAWNLKKNIVNTISQSSVVVISGETGCGKSTQVPQYILDEWIKNYAKDDSHVEIVCTQPRRISAIGVAERVADERIEYIGNTVGYQIRLESKVSSKTRLTFCTTGILLRRLEGEPTLPNVTHIIVDEVHERSEESDFLLLILKELLQIRTDLKVILMSATLNASLFSDYFGNIPIIDIPGRTFPVEQYFLEDILETTGYILEEGTEYCRKIKQDEDYLEVMMAANEVTFEINKPSDKVRDENLRPLQIMSRYETYSLQTCKNIFLHDPDKINYELIECVLEWIVSRDHRYPVFGTILIFLPGISEITTLYDQLNVHKIFGKRTGKYIVLPLHSSLSSEEQSAIFKKPSGGQRKIVLSTNLAETSVTIDDCTFVIDCGKMKEKRFDPNRNMESLETAWVTRANALQRKGRAGRVMSGVCIHLYTNHRFKYNLLSQPIPEINRIPLEQLILNIKILQNFENRDVVKVLEAFIEPPSQENIVTAVKRLENVGALDKEDNLTALGHHLAKLPVDVRIGKLILYGAIFGCVDASLTMAACLSSKSPFVSPFGKKEEANKKKITFATGISDHITTLNAYRKFLEMYKKSSYGAKNFANENYLSFRTLISIADIKRQFLELLVDIGFVPINLGRRKRMGWDDIHEITGSELNKNGDNNRLLSSVLCAALYPNVVKILTPSKSYIMSASGAVPKENEAKDLKFATSQETIFMHPSSVNYKVRHFPSPYMVYQEKIQTSKIFFRDCTMVPVLPLILFSSYDLNINIQGGNTFIVLEDGFIVFQVEEHRIAEMIKLIRQELFNLLEEKIRDPLLNLLHNDRGEKIITTILRLVNV